VSHFTFNLKVTTALLNVILINVVLPFKVTFTQALMQYVLSGDRYLKNRIEIASTNELKNVRKLNLRTWPNVLSNLKNRHLI
jgi:hypothetical protein